MEGFFVELNSSLKVYRKIKNDVLLTTNEAQLNYEYTSGKYDIFTLVKEKRTLIIHGKQQ